MLDKVDQEKEFGLSSRREINGTFHNNKGSIPQDIMTKLQII